jgi:hypothetical protein
MKTTFYCVNVEFYDGGKVLACVTSSGKMGKTQYRKTPGMRAFKLWQESEEQAKKLLESIEAGKVGEDDIMFLYSNYKSLMAYGPKVVAA